DVDELRADPSGIEHLGVAEIVDHYEEVIRALDAAPILMGHSFGGLFVQLLLDRGLGVAGVAIDSAAAKGVFTLPPAELRSAFPVLKSPLNNHRAVALTPEEFHYAFTNTMSEEEWKAAYERYAVPGPGGVLSAAASRSPTATSSGQRPTHAKWPALRDRTSSARQPRGHPVPAYLPRRPPVLRPRRVERVGEAGPGSPDDRAAARRLGQSRQLGR